MTSSSMTSLNLSANEESAFVRQRVTTCAASLHADSVALRHKAAQALGIDPGDPEQTRLVNAASIFQYDGALTVSCSHLPRGVWDARGLPSQSPCAMRTISSARITATDFGKFDACLVRRRLARRVVE